MKAVTFVFVLVATLSLTASAQQIGGCMLSTNPYAANSTSNPYSSCGSPYSAESINNPYGKYGSPFSPYSVTNPYATEAPMITADDDTYLGRYSANRYAPDSTSNPYAPYGSPFAANSINNSYGNYGSMYSPQSPFNPYTVTAPVLSDDDDPE